ncbi:S-methyl-5'-thioadenosine phosphorylase [Oscillatoria amoena NRMC-F 0135]|nr:S-methyl-5'-thioadenosine phosphorylase [Oscillatoria laete-virens]MDL5047529.1 S-methyl-5'-thioadenosine phosphorylase [Oscillatoria amoena NRMC-F 0135]MDL5054648.1 S-methyl-5'-thioadenosine phosphorylase [Oscillatoria laete-virens NRMC-F 0139]
MSKSNIPAIGIIGGSGLYEIDGISHVREVTVKTPFGAPSDRLIRGQLEGREVVFLARHARGHRILPGEINHRANIWAFKKLGVAWIISVSACGSLRKELPPRSIVLPDQFFDRTKRPLTHTFFGGGVVGHVNFAEPTCVPVQKILARIAKGKKAKVSLGGTYVCMEGPAFSTKAESFFYRKCGFDIIGMTNLPEAKLAREAQIAYAPMCFVTDYDCWHPDHDHVTVEMIVGNLHANAGLAKDILRAVIPAMPTRADDPAHSALATAIITPRGLWPAKTAATLKILLQKHG